MNYKLVQEYKKKSDVIDKSLQLSGPSHYIEKVEG